MRTVIATVIASILCSSVFAADLAKLNLHIANPVKENKYFLCLYGIGCLSIRAGNHGKTYPVMASTDLGNIQKIVITDVSSMRMHMQPMSSSCQRVVNKNQHVTITGQLVLKNHTPYINNLHCTIV